MIERLKPFPFVFWKSAAGHEPGPSGSTSYRKRIIARVQFGWPAGFPVCRPMGEGLRETPSPSKREARVCSAFALTAFIKKTLATPAGELALAQQRWKEVTA
jgi:hypothetical protein